MHKHHDKETSWGGKGLFGLHFLHCCSSPKEDRTGTQAGQEAGVDAEAMEGCSLLACLLPLACSACSLIEPKDYEPRDGPTHKGPFPLDH